MRNGSEGGLADPARTPPRGGLIATVLIIAFAAMSIMAALNTPFPNNYDERAHLSAIAHNAQHGVTDPAAETMWLLPSGLGRSFSTETNYLNHPPAYYATLALLLPADGWPTAATVMTLRWVNVGLSTAAFATLMGIARLRGLSETATLVFGAIVLLNPVLPYLGGAITNDNLAMLGGALTVLGAQHLVSRDGPRTGWALLILGCALASLAKLTAGMMTGVFTVVFLCHRWRQAGWQVDRRFVALWIIVQIVACLPYGWLLLRHGTPAPLTAGFVDEYRRIAALGTHLFGWVPNAALSLPAYGVAFLTWLGGNWNPVTAMTGWPRAGVLAGSALVMALALPALVVNLPIRRYADGVIGSGSVAMTIMLPLHLLFSYRMHRETGSPPFDAVPRYYFPLALAIIPAAMCWSLDRLPARARAVLTLLIPITLAVALPIILRCAGGACG